MLGFIFQYLSFAEETKIGQSFIMYGLPGALWKVNVTSLWHIKWSFCIVYSSILKEFDTKDVPRDWLPNATFQDLSTQLNVKLKILLRQRDIQYLALHRIQTHFAHTSYNVKNLGQIREFLFFQPPAFLIVLEWLVSSCEEIQKASYLISFQLILKKPIPPSLEWRSLCSFRNIFLNNTRLKIPFQPHRLG